jgi:hypothetical protein
MRLGLGLGISRNDGGPAMSLNFLSPFLDPRITFSRGTSATRVNASGFIETVGTTTPRFDYDPVTLAPKGLLIEEARTNLLTNSTGFGANWASGANSTVTANGGSAPDGTTAATRITLASGVTNNRYLNTPVTVTPGSAYTFSVFLKTVSGALFQAVILVGATGSARGWLNTSTGAISGVTSTNYTGVSMVATNFGNGWWRVALTATVVTDTVVQVETDQASASGNYNSAVGDSYLFWGAQLEQASFATSYIPTVASTVTRSADVATMTGTNFSSWYNQTQGSFVVNADAIATGVNRVIVGGGGGSLGYPSYIRTIQTGAVFDTANVVASPNVITEAAFKLATTYESGALNTCLNGAAVATGLYNGVFASLTSIALGSSGASTLFLNGHIRSIAYYNTRLPDAQLQSLTA